MTRSINNSASVWAEWTDRDDRQWLNQLRSENYEAASCRTSVFPWIHLIVASVSFAGHSRWGLQASKETTSKLSQDFFDWLGDTCEWEHFHTIFDNQTQGPWSLPLLLNRAYHRYCFDVRFFYQDKHRQNKQIPDALSKIGSQIVDAFLEKTSSIENLHKRTALQLFLDGLLEEEIAALTGRSLSAIQTDIAEAKQALINEIDETEFGT